MITMTVTSFVTRHKDIRPKGIKHQQSPSVRMKREGRHWIVWREIESFSCGQPLMHPQAKINANEPMKRNSARWKRRSGI
ncbi:TPA: hypothetical protein ACU8BJ_002371 [Neisseria subflava]